mgnify:CR=1 FL=1
MAEKKEEMMEEVLEDLEKDAAEKQAEEVSEASQPRVSTMMSRTFSNSMIYLLVSVKVGSC